MSTYFTTLTKDQKKALALQGACNSENAKVERFRQIREARNRGAGVRVKYIWKNPNVVKISLNWRQISLDNSNQ